ncbi:SPFH domain-containing protein [Solemya velum gill symbiont]|uniref:SPFH domain-containing protein n=1 Tax=Solemya velum gill symbiont TaxID=2340 RepID=UPI0030B8B538
MIAYLSYMVFGFIALLVLWAIFILREYERGVIFTLGRFWKVKGPGLIIVIPIIQQMVRVDLRTVVMDVPEQDVISRDNVSVKVNAVIYFRVDPPPISWSTLMMSKTEDRKWESSDTNRKKSSRNCGKLKSWLDKALPASMRSAKLASLSRLTTAGAKSTVGWGLTS